MTPIVPPPAPGKDDPGTDVLPPDFEVLCGGKAGGKVQGLAWVARLRSAGVALAGDHDERLRIPPPAVLGADLFHRVLDEAGIHPRLRSAPTEELHDAVIRQALPGDVRERLRDYLAQRRRPLAVRSSSLLEDDHRHAFSGIHRTRFIANVGDDDERLASLEEAIRIVLASAFLPRAEAYRKRHGLLRVDEAMAVLLQPVVGVERGRWFHPLLAGVGFSRNMYPWSDRLRVEDGVVRLCYGLGTRAVDRGFARVFVPSHPRLRPEGFTVPAIERYAQESVDLLDMEGRRFVQGVQARDLLDAKGNDLHLVASLVREGEVLKSPLFPLDRDARFVLTFDEVIAGRHGLPLVPILRSLFASLERSMGGPVDIEFAVPHLDPDGDDGPPAIHLLQVRPLGVREAHRTVTVDPGDGHVVLASRRVMGNGERSDLRRLVVVLAEEYLDARPSRTVAEIRRLNAALDGEPWMLVGPGRWGSSHPRLGVPVRYDALSGAVAIVEVSAGEMCPEVSYGTHFFGDLLSTGTFYMAVCPEEGDVFDADFLRARSAPPVDGVRLVTLPEPLVLQVDGRSARGAAFLTRDGP